MGRVNAISGGRYGLYTASIEYDTRGAALAITAIDEEIEAINEKLQVVYDELAEIQADIVDKRVEHEDLARAYTEAVEAMQEANDAYRESVTHPEADDGMGPGSIDMGSMTGRNPFGHNPDWWFTFGGYDWEMGDGDSEDSGFESVGSGLSNLGDEARMSAEQVTPEITQAFSALYVSASELRVLLNREVAIEKFRDMYLYRIESLELKKDQIQAAAAPGDPQSMWCADLRQDLTGTVESLEVKGAPDPVLIGPQGLVNVRDSGGSPGILARPLAMSPAQCALAWALLPGWQKYRPTYRVGVIHDIDYDNDTASVTLDAATSEAQGLDINQAPAELVAVPVSYMSCNAEAFEEDERVVVEFPGQLWAQGPRVIGFETNPMPCRGYVGMVGSTNNYTTIGDANIYEWHQGQTSNYQIDIARTPVPANSMELNNLYRLGTKIKLGCTWRYPWPPPAYTRYEMELCVYLEVYAADGSVLVSMPLQVPYGAPPPYSFTPLDKTFGPNLDRHYVAYYSMLNRTGLPSYGSAPCWHDPLNPVGVISSMTEYYAAAYYINGLSDYRAPYCEEYIWDWLNMGYQACMGMPETLHYTLEGYDTEYLGHATPTEAGFYSWFGFGDPLGDGAAAPGNLYANQSWSMEGTIEADGIHLSDTLVWPVFGRENTPLQFGSYSPINATEGACVLTYGVDYQGEVPALQYVHPDNMAVPHHLGFAVKTLTTNDHKMAAITTKTAPSGGLTWSEPQAESGPGYATFYALAELDRTRKIET